MLRHFETVLQSAGQNYLPFRKSYGGIEAEGWHNLHLGVDVANTDDGIAEAQRYALDVFPEATIVQVWETNVLGDRKQLLVDTRQEGEPKPPLPLGVKSCT